MSHTLRACRVVEDWYRRVQDPLELSSAQIRKLIDLIEEALSETRIVAPRPHQAPVQAEVRKAGQSVVEYEAVTGRETKYYPPPQLNIQNLAQTLSHREARLLSVSSCDEEANTSRGLLGERSSDASEQK